MRLISNVKRTAAYPIHASMVWKNQNGSWIAILDSDDAWAPDKIGKADCPSKENECRFAFSRVQLSWTRMGSQSTGIFMLRQK